MSPVLCSCVFEHVTEDVEHVVATAALTSRGLS